MDEKNQSTVGAHKLAKTALFAFMTAEAVLYALFLRIDFFGGSSARSAMYKYAGILLCLVCASVRAVTLKNTASRLIAAALFFTCISDYFLLFTDSYLPGVLCFCDHHDALTHQTTRISQQRQVIISCQERSVSLSPGYDFHDLDITIVIQLPDNI